MTAGWLKIQHQSKQHLKVLSYQLDLTKLGQWTTHLQAFDSVTERVETLEEQTGVTPARVRSVHGRTGDVVAQASDYQSFYDSIGAAAAVNTLLAAHRNDRGNPHQVTAAQIGALENSIATAADPRGNSDDVLLSEGAADAHYSKGLVVQQTVSQDTTNRSTTSSSMVSSGVSASLTAGAASRKYRARFHGVIGSDSSGKDIELTVYRQINGGAATDLTPVGVGAMVECRSVSSSDNAHTIPFTIEIEDSPAASASDTVTYLLYWRVAGGSGTAYLGRRGLDTNYDCPTTVVVEELLP